MAVTLFRDLGYLGAAKQSAKGTTVAPATFFVLRKQAFIPSQQIGEFRTGNQRDISFAVKEAFKYAGSFQTFMYANETAALLAWVMGADTKTGSADPWTHTLALADPLPYLTFEAAFYDSQIIDRIGDSKIAMLEIEAEAGKEALVNVDLLGSFVEGQGSAATVSFTNPATDGPMKLSPHSVFTLSGPTDASTIAGQIAKMKLKIDQGMDAVMGPGVIYPIALHEQARKIEYELEVYFAGEALYNLVHYGASAGTSVSDGVSTGAFDVVFTSTAASPGPERSIKLTSANIFWLTATPEFSPDGKTGKMTVKATAFRNGATLPFTAVCKNGNNTAYI